jgi:hypothetical protein
MRFGWREAPSGRLSGQPPRKEEEMAKFEQAIAPREDPDNPTNGELLGGFR